MLKVLFLCTGNSCRSQLAEGWAGHLKGDVIEAHLAGVAKHGVHPHAVAVMTVMAEAGVDITSQRSKRRDELADLACDYLVIVCDNAAASCPVFRGKTEVIHRPFDAPPRLACEAVSDGDAMGHCRRVRDKSREYVATLPSH